MSWLYEYNVYNVGARIPSSGPARPPQAPAWPPGRQIDSLYVRYRICSAAHCYSTELVPAHRRTVYELVQGMTRATSV